MVAGPRGVGSLSAPRSQIEALLERHRRLVLKSKRCWNAIGASFSNRSVVGTLSEPRSQIEAPIGPKSHPTYNHKPKNAPPTRGALNQLLFFLLLRRPLAAGQILVHLIKDAVDHGLIIGFDQKVGDDAVDDDGTHKQNIILYNTEYNCRQ